jgi:hypothetical protein
MSIVNRHGLMRLLFESLEDVQLASAVMTPISGRPLTLAR